MTHSDPHSIELMQLDVANLERLAARQPLELGGMATPHGSLPPSKVVERALAGVAAGVPALWCLPFLIVRTSRDVVLGSCGFKGAPLKGSVEISYGLAPMYRGSGIGTAAVMKLLALARNSGEVVEVIAHILRGNRASERLVERLGFHERRRFIDLDGTDVAQWVWQTTSRDAV